jgi:hypothetical protein
MERGLSKRNSQGVRNHVLLLTSESYLWLPAKISLAAQSLLEGRVFSPEEFLDHGANAANAPR